MEGRGAHSVLEVSAGSLDHAGLKVGDSLSCSPVEGGCDRPGLSFGGSRRPDPRFKIRMGQPAVTLGDALVAHFYVGAAQGRGANPNGVAYDSLKDGDWNGDTVLDAGDRVGLRYDRSPSAPPDPPWDAGPPDGAVSISDVLVVVAQVGLSCAGPP
jgi:hypothetical protein